MNIGESMKDFRIEVDLLGGAFVKPYLENSRKLQNILSGLLLPLGLVGTIWASLAYLWWLFLVSVVDFSLLLSDVPLLSLVLLFASGLTYFCLIFTEGMLFALRKGAIRIDRRTAEPASLHPQSSSNTTLHHQIASNNNIPRSSGYSGEFARPLS